MKSKIITKLNSILQDICIYLGLGMRGKLIVLFMVIKIFPLILLALVAWNQSANLAQSLRVSIDELSAIANESLIKTSKIAINDAVIALDERATEEIERMSTNTAKDVANFLYARDADVRFLASFPPNEKIYETFITNKQDRLILPGNWQLSADGMSWQPADPKPEFQTVQSSNTDNNERFSYRHPTGYAHESRPLYLEATFVDLTGQEQIKVTSSPHMDKILKNVADPKNTYVKAEDYFAELKKLKIGEIYVSDVIGAYVPSKIIGTYNPKNAAKVGISFEPEKSAYAGKENPLGKRFKGLVRFATPVEQNGKIIGYTTIALDHDHLMEFTAHDMPTKDRYTIIPDASEGNYAFIWDYKGRSIVHPRHFSIAGYDPETGHPAIPWLEDRIYDEWQASGKEYIDFIADVPVFVEQSQTKKSAPQLTKQGLVGLDCRYLNFAPQCTGWFDLTQHGGSGSFLILWSDLWKLTTAAAIPYYTGKYGESKRGFGFVAIGAGVDDFHSPAIETKKEIDALTTASNNELKAKGELAQKNISSSLLETAISLSVSTLIMCIMVILIAIWLASMFTNSITKLVNGISRFRAGHWDFRFNSDADDELGKLANSFDDMADGVVNSVTTTLVIIDRDKNILFCNNKSLSKINKNLEDIIGKQYSEISFFPEQSQYCTIRALLNNTESEPIYRAQDGRYYKGNASYLIDNQNNKIGYIIKTSDVTDLILQQQKVEEQRSLLDLVLTSSPDLIWYINNAGKFIIINPRVASIVGKSSEELLYLGINKVFYGNMSNIAQIFSSNYQLVLDSGSIVHFVENIQFADGHNEILDCLNVPLINADNEIIGVLGVARDISERINVENKLLHTQKDLEIAVSNANIANKAKSEFLARISHEIRTPMNAIIGMTNITQRKLSLKNPNFKDINGHIRQIEISAKHLLGLINDILDLSKIEAGKLELNFEPFNFGQLIESVSNIIQPRCLEKNINFYIETNSLETLSFESDTLRLRQVLINLLGNAVKFTPELGRVDFMVSVEQELEDKSLLKFIIQDNGIGITADVLQNLFTPFEQGLSEISVKFGGTGLGLSISKRIINMFEGEILVESVPDVGSTFSFSLWLTKSSLDVYQEIEVDWHNQLDGKRILLVDDVEINRIIVTELLDGTNLSIDEASNGNEAITKFKNSPVNHYDLILMDIQMPLVDGYAATKAIRGLDRPDALIPIIALTANAFKDDADKALACGMNAHLPKPIEYANLMSALYSHLK